MFSKASDFVKSEELTYKYYIKHKIKSYNRRSGLLKTIEKKKKQLEEFSSEKTKAKKPNTNSDQNQAQFHINKQSEKSPEKLKRSIVRGKLLYENAMEAVEKKYHLFYFILFFSNFFKEN